MTVFDTAPSILRETSRGLERTSIYDELLRERTLVISGEIEPLMASALCQHVLFLEREDPSSPITLFVSSPGGQRVRDSPSTTYRARCPAPSAQSAATSPHPWARSSSWQEKSARCTRTHPS